jgi:hypothetical protein
METGVSYRSGGRGEREGGKRGVVLTTHLLLAPRVK